MNNITRLLVRIGCGIFAASAVSLSALAMTNEESAQLMKITDFVVPTYPSDAKLHGFAEGTVTAIIAHNTTGQTTDVLVLDSSHPLFTEAVRAAVGRWKFAPDAAAGTEHAPLVRFYFSTKGVVILQAPNLHSGQLGLKPDTLRFPTFAALDERPKAIEQPMPEFPSALRGRVSEGTAKVAFYVDEDGHARAPVVTEATSPEFAAAALAAVGHWRYETPKQNGRAVVAVENWNFRFAGPSGS